METGSQENESTYVVDAESAVELARLMKQDRLITRCMGGIFPEGPDLSSLHDILDIACGPGGWVLDVAYECPKAQVVGVDISQRMISYARAQAQSQGLENASFRVMDASNALEFQANSFDLVNSRLLTGFMPRTVWPNFVHECVRVARPAGIIRLTESDTIFDSNSPACEKMNHLIIQAISLNKLGFSSNGKSVDITQRLERFLRDAGCVNIHKALHVIDFSVGTEAYEGYRQNFMIGYQLVQPLLMKMGLIEPEEFDKLYQQATIEMLSDDFKASWTFLSTWGYKQEQ